MSVRIYEFDTGYETSNSPDPGTPSGDSDVITKGYADDTYTPKSSFYSKQPDHDGIRAISSADRSDGQVVFDYGASEFWTFDAASSATDDDENVLQPDSGTGRWTIVAGGVASSGDGIVQNLHNYNSGIQCAEAIADRDCIAMEIHNGTGSNVYRYYKADSNNILRRSVVGFTKGAGTVTPEISTYTISAAYVSGNVIPITINGRSYSITYASSSDATLQSVATAIQGDPDVLTATVTVVGGNQTGTDDRVITITSEGGLSLNISGTTVTGGASQPTVTIAETQAASGSTLMIHEFGPLGGFSGLSVGYDYFLSDTAGAVTSTQPQSSPIYVGKAIATDTLFVDINGSIGSRRWGGIGIFIRSQGTENGSTTVSNADTEHFNYSAWTAGVTGGVALRNSGASPSNYLGLHHGFDGWNASNAATNGFYSYDRSAWSALTARGTPRAFNSLANFSGYLFVHGGNTDAGSHGTPTATVDKWNGSAWSTGTSITTATTSMGTFQTNSLLDVFGGDTGGGGVTTHYTKTSADALSTATAVPTATDANAGANFSTSSGVITGVGNSAATTTSYSWNGSAWSSSITASQSQFSDRQGGCGYDSSKGLFIQNGGQTAASSSPVNTTQLYNGFAFSTTTASTQTVSASIGSIS